MGVNEGKDLLLSIDDGAAALVEVPNQGAGTYKTGKTANTTIHKNGQTPWQARAGESFDTDFTTRRPMLASHQRILDLAASGEIVAVKVADAATGGMLITGNAMVTVGDYTSGTEGPLTIPLTVTFDGSPVHAVSP